MKKSNIILITTSALIMLITIGFLVYSKNAFVESKINENMSFSEKEIPEISVLVVESKANVTFIQSDSTMLRIKDIAADSINDNFFTIKSDTLFAFNKKPMTIYNKNLKTVICKDEANVNIEKIKTDSMNVNNANGKIHFSKGDGYVELKKLNISSKSGEINIWHTFINELNIESESTIMRITGKYDNMNLKIKDATIADIRDADIGKMNFERDESSQIDM